MTRVKQSLEKRYIPLLALIKVIKAQTGLAWHGHLWQHGRWRARGTILVRAPALLVFLLHPKNQLSQELLLEMGPFTKSTFRRTHTKVSCWRSLLLLPPTSPSSAVNVDVPVMEMSSPDSSRAI